MNTVLINSQFVHILKPCDTITTQKIHHFFAPLAAFIPCPAKAPKYHYIRASRLHYGADQR